MHCVLQVKEGSEGNQQPVIVCTNQVLSDAEAAVMKRNGWLYHYYSVQNKIHYGLAYDAAHPASRLLYYSEHRGHGIAEIRNTDLTTYPHLSAMPVTLHTQLSTHTSTTNQGQQTPHRHHHHRRTESEPVDYSYNKRKSKENIRETEVEGLTETDAGEGGEGLLVISHLSDRPRTLLKVDPHELMDQWNPSPPWSENLQKVPDLFHQDLSPCVGSTPPTPTATPNMNSGGVFSFDWMPEQYVPSIVNNPVALTCVEDAERPHLWANAERVFPLQPPPKRNHTQMDNNGLDPEKSS